MGTGARYVRCCAENTRPRRWGGPSPSRSRRLASGRDALEVLRGQDVEQRTTDSQKMEWTSPRMARRSPPGRRRSISRRRSRRRGGRAGPGQRARRAARAQGSARPGPPARCGRAARSPRCTRSIAAVSASGARGGRGGVEDALLIEPRGGPRGRHPACPPRSARGTTRGRARAGSSSGSSSAATSAGSVAVERGARPRRVLLRSSTVAVLVEQRADRCRGSPLPRVAERRR